MSLDEGLSELRAATARLSLAEEFLIRKRDALESPKRERVAAALARAFEAVREARNIVSGEDVPAEAPSMP